MSNSNTAPIDWFATTFRNIRDNVERIIQGKRRTIDLALIALLAEGHLLIEDVPGTGKTTLARALTNSIGGHWTRIQFTPDLLPSDVTGVSVWNQSAGQFEFRTGPVFTNIVIGDEINRASPKTQSALLEVMEERQVTYDGVAHPVPRPFMVIATQNPVEHQGTYRLPEAQLDRFLMQIDIGYPDPVDEIKVIDLSLEGVVTEHLNPVIGVDEVRLMIGTAKSVQVAPALKDYVVRIAGATRNDDRVQLGISPRATVALVRAAQAVAAASGRGYVTPEDIKGIAQPVLAHRLQVRAAAAAGGAERNRVIGDILATVPVPSARAV